MSWLRNPFLLVVLFCLIIVCLDFPISAHAGGKDVIVVSSHGEIDSSGQYKLLLEVQNKGDHRLTSIKVTVKFDNKTKTIGENSAYTLIKYLEPNEKSPALINYPNKGIVKYEVTDINYIVSESYPYDKLVLNIKQVKGASTRIFGNITNTGSEKTESIRIVTSSFDINNTIRDVVVSTISGLKPLEKMKPDFNISNRTGLLRASKVAAEVDLPLIASERADYSNWFLFLGLFPMYIGALFVEKYYTAFWTAFWNIWGLFIICLGLTIDNPNWGSVLIGGFIVLVLGLVIWGVIFGDADDLVRNIGSSIVVSSLTWGIWFWFRSNPVLGILAAVINFFITLFLASIFHG